MPTPTREEVEAALKDFLCKHSFQARRPDTLFNTIKALKLGVSDRQDHQELVKLMDQMEPGEYKFPNQATKALVTKYAKYWEGKHHECWESR
jgi:hypothetical protein